MNLHPMDPRDLARAMGDPSAIHGPARHLSADDDDPPAAPFWFDAACMAACLVIAIVWVVAIRRLP